MKARAWFVVAVLVWREDVVAVSDLRLSRSTVMSVVDVVVTF